MTIQEGMQEAFRRLGRNEKEIEQVCRIANSIYGADAAEVRETPILPGKEEEFITAYTQLNKLIVDGPLSEQLQQAIEHCLERN
jgi:hypothetical protein